MHQPWDQVPTDLRYGPPVAKASRRSYQPDLVDKGFLDFLLADNAQLPAAAPPPQQQSPFDLAYGSNQIGAQAPSAVYDDGPFMSQQHTFQWVPTPGAPGISRASDSLPASDTAQTGPSEPLGESVGHKHKRMEEAANSGQANDDFGLGTSAAQLQHSGEHSGSDFEDNKKLTKAERTARMREKNKTAQKRWRDRQKAKLSDSEKKLLELSSKLEHLMLEKSAVENRNNILEKVLVMRDQELSKYKAEDCTARRQAEQHQTPFTMQDGYRSNAYLTFSVRDNTRITCEALKAMSTIELSKLYKDFVNKLAVFLLEARGNDHSPVQTQIDKLVNECSAMCASLAMSNPSAIRALHCSNFDGALMVQQGPSSSKWLSISRSLSLSPQQKKELLAGRHYYLTKLRDVLQQRKALLATLEGVHGVKTTQHALALDYVTLSRVMEKLQANIQEDHQLTCGFMYATWKRVMTLFQRGNVIVQSYPYMPDMLAVANAIAADDQAPSAETLLQQAGVPDSVVPAAQDAEVNKAPWLIPPKQEDNFLQTMNIPLMASMMPHTQPL